MFCLMFLGFCCGGLFSCYKIWIGLIRGSFLFTAFSFDVVQPEGLDLPFFLLLSDIDWGSSFACRGFFLLTFFADLASEHPRDAESS